jgi:hypothetical protein
MVPRTRVFEEDNGGRFPGSGALSALAGAGGATATTENRDPGRVGMRIGLMDKERNMRVSVLPFVPSLSVSKGGNIFGAVAIIDFESGVRKIQCRMAKCEKQLKAERRRDT